MPLGAITLQEKREYKHPHQIKIVAQERPQTVFRA
jgi:hypothetical protein